MKFIIAILLFLSLFCKSQAEARMGRDDTTKFVLVNDYDIKPTIIKELAKCFTIVDFKPVVIYFRTFVEFSIKRIDKYKREFVTTENVTEYGAIQKLNDIFKSLQYSRFKILSGKNVFSDDVLIVQVFLYEDNDDLVINVYFVLDSHSAIKTVAIM